MCEILWSNFTQNVTNFTPKKIFKVLCFAINKQLIKHWIIVVQKVRHIEVAQVNIFIGNGGFPPPRIPLWLERVAGKSQVVPKSLKIKVPGAD